MLIAISPAKSLNDDCAVPSGVRLTKPRFWGDATALAAALNQLGEKKLGTLMHISDKLAALNAERYASFPKTISAKNGKPAGYYFSGDVYQGLDFASLPTQHLPDAQARLRMLSGLYGVLRPLDAMHPYRLEMGTRFATHGAKDLYGYWGSRIAEALNADANAYGTDILVNLASNEYAKAIDKKALTLREVKVDFKERKGNQLKVLGLFAKRARGMMARYILQYRLKKPAELQGFDADGYAYAPELSTENHLIFVRG